MMSAPSRQRSAARRLRHGSGSPSSSDGLAGRDRRPDPLLDQLEEGLDRPDHEHRVPEEADQLADLELSGDHLAGAEPGQHDQEQPGEQDSHRVERGLPDPGGDARPAGSPGTAVVVAARTYARRRSRAGSAARRRCRWPVRSARRSGCARPPAGAASAGAAASRAAPAAVRRPARRCRARARWTRRCRR